MGHEHGRRTGGRGRGEMGGIQHYGYRGRNGLQVLSRCEDGPAPGPRLQARPSVGWLHEKRHEKVAHRIFHEHVLGDCSGRGHDLCKLMEKRKRWGASPAVRFMGQGDKAVVVVKINVNVINCVCEKAEYAPQHPGTKTTINPAEDNCKMQCEPNTNDLDDLEQVGTKERKGEAKAVEGPISTHSQKTCASAYVRECSISAEHSCFDVSGSAWTPCLTFLSQFLRARLAFLWAAARIRSSCNAVYVRTGVTRRKLQTPGNAEEHKRQETPTINYIGPTDKPHRPSTKHYRKDSPGDA